MLGGIVRGKKTTLRVPTEADLVHVNAWMADMRVRRGGHLWEDPATIETWKERLKELAKERATILWTIEAEGRPIGSARIVGQPDAYGQEILHFFLDADRWGHGYGTDAAIALHRYVFDYRDYQWTALEVPADNAAALRVGEKIGYTEFGRGHEVYYRDGAYVDKVFLRLDRKTWDEKWGATEREYAPLPEDIAR